MAVEKQDITISSVEAGNNKYSESHPLTLSTGGDVIAKGTILARHSTNFKWILFVKGGSSNGNGIPKAVMGYPVTGPTAAGDVMVRPIVGGDVRAQQLIIDADGDGDNIDKAVLDQLRDFGINPIETEFDVSFHDNS